MQDYFDRKSRAPSPSLNKVSRMWYSAPPDLTNHNKDIVKIFLSLFRKHIPSTFPLFTDTVRSQKNQVAYTLAMAATGGMFCKVAGSTAVAKSMYNDARRLLLASFSVRDTTTLEGSSPQDRLVVVKTFILLELYGLCSGDKRSYEFVEAFHGNLIHALQEYSHACQMFPDDLGTTEQNTHLLESLYILDCYHVVIIQHPPSLSWHHIDSFANSPPPASRMQQLGHCLQELTNGHVPINPHIDEFSLPSLAALCVYLWPAAYARQNRYGSDEVVIESLSLWKPDFAESACNNWLRAIGPKRNPSELTIYHLMNIMLHANLAVVQHFAHSPPGSAARDAKKSAIGKEITAWVQSRHYQIACWHAEQLITTIEGAFMSSGNRSEQQPSSRTSVHAEPRRLPYEAPHVPYAVYYATLVVWCRSVFKEEKTKSSTSGGWASIARGERILSLHDVHIAQLLAHVLNEVK
jgi:hypothetical protein